MKPLTVQQKKFLYEKLAFGPLRWIAKPLYDLLLGVELYWHRMEDAFHPGDKTDVKDLTAVIKTFERPYAVKRLIKSIRHCYPELKIIVVDDSKQPEKLADVHQIIMPYDSGISAGRNRALDELETPYFLLLDDDFVFSHRQNLGELLGIMRRYEEIDIVGGRCIDLPFYIQHDFHDMPLRPEAAEPKVPVGTMFDGHPVVNKVQNYFIGRTETVRGVKWNPKQKIHEHTEFFTRACGRLTTVFHSGMNILHAKTPFDISYLKMRFRRS